MEIVLRNALYTFVAIDTCINSGNDPTELTSQAMDGNPSVSLTGSTVTSTQQLEEILKGGKWTSQSDGTLFTVTLHVDQAAVIVSVTFIIEGASAIEYTLEYEDSDEKEPVSSKCTTF